MPVWQASVSGFPNDGKAIRALNFCLRGCGDRATSTVEYTASAIHMKRKLTDEEAHNLIHNQWDQARKKDFAAPIPVIPRDVRGTEEGRMRAKVAKLYLPPDIQWLAEEEVNINEEKEHGEEEDVV